MIYLYLVPLKAFKQLMQCDLRIGGTMSDVKSRGESISGVRNDDFGRDRLQTGTGIRIFYPEFGIFCLFQFFNFFYLFFSKEYQTRTPNNVFFKYCNTILGETSHTGIPDNRKWPKIVEKCQKWMFLVICRTFLLFTDTDYFTCF